MKLRDKMIKFFMAFLIIAFALPVLQAKAITIDADNEYTLSIGECPSDISNYVYAKFKSSKKDYEDYELNLVEDDEEVFLNALKKAKVTIDESHIAVGFTTELIYTDPDSGDDKKKTDGVTVLCPIPDDAQEHPDDCIFYQVSSGTAKVISSQRVKDSDEIIYEKFDLPTYGMYGFVYRDPYSYDEDEDENQDEDEDENEDEDEDDNEDDNEDDDWDWDEDEDENNNENDSGTSSNDEIIEPEDDENFEYTEEDDNEDDGFEYSDEDFEDDSSSTDENGNVIEEFDSDAEDDDGEPYYYEPDDGDYYYEENQNTSSGNDDSSTENPSTDESSSEVINSDNSEADSQDIDSSDDETTSSYQSDPHVLDNTGSTEYDFNTTSRASSTSNASYSGAVPKTGDDFPLEAFIGLSVISLATLVGTIILIFKHKK